MKLTVERASLHKALGHVTRIVERRITIPILSNVLLDAVPGCLRLRATDLDLEVAEPTEADVERPGALTVSAQTLLDIARKLPDGPISFDAPGSGDRMIVTSGRSRFTLQTLPATDFPDLSTGEFPHKFEIPARALKGAIEKAQFAISTEETRYYLNGIYLHTLDVEGHSKLRAVATDGHRLARVEMAAPEGADGMPGVILPRKLVSEVAKLIDGVEAPITIEVSASKVRFTSGELVVTSKLIDGQFPDYARVIPTGNDKIALIDRKALGEAVDRVTTVSGERGRAVKLALDAGRLILTVINPDTGTATEEMEATYDAPAIEIGFNGRYLADCLGAIDSDQVRMSLADPGSPTLLEPSDGNGLTTVLMPMRV